MADTLIARQGDTLDALLWRERNMTADDLPAVLAANPGIAALGAVLPLGTPVIVPETARPDTRTLPVIQLWD